MADTTLGWQIAVEHPGDGATEIYNVAISDERQAMDAVRACVRNANGIVVKVKSQLTRRLCKALKLRPGEVKRSMRHPTSRRYRHRRPSVFFSIQRTTWIADR